MTNFEEYAYSTELIDKLQQQKDALIEQQKEIERKIQGLEEYQKELIKEILIINTSCSLKHPETENDGKKFEGCLNN